MAAFFIFRIDGCLWTTRGVMTGILSTKNRFKKKMD